MNFTEHYQLNQWEGTDRVLREDFNRDNRKIEEAFLSLPKIVLGSYTGTGGYRADQPNILELPFQPKLLFVFGGVMRFITTYGEGTTNCSPTGHSDGTLYLTWAGNTLKWHTYNGDPHDQMNAEGEVYHYVVIG